MLDPALVRKRHGWAWEVECAMFDLALVRRRYA